MKLPVISGKEALKALEWAGFVVVRQRGSHVRIKKVTSESVINITIPLHDINLPAHRHAPEAVDMNHDTGRNKVKNHHRPEHG